MRTTLLLAAALLAVPAGALAQAPGPAGGDFTRWEGRWYEVARLANWPQRNCGPEVVATVLRRTDGEISVIHQCRTAEGEWDVAIGRGRFDEGAPADTLGVRFSSEWLTWPPFTFGSYYAVDLDVNARYALLGSQDREHLWVLSQTRTIDPAVYQHALARASQLGYDTSKLIRPAR